MLIEVTKTRGKGRACTKCRIRIADYEECNEVVGKPYHTTCTPTNAQQGNVTVELVQHLQNPKQRFISPQS